LTFADMENEDLNLVSEDKRFEKTRKLSIIEGASASVMSGAGDSYITPYAIELQANNFQVGLLSSLGGFIGPISQIFGSKLMEKYPRKRIVVTAVIFQASMWIALLSLGFIFLKHGKTEYLIPLLICAYVLYALFGSFGGPAWFSLMGDAVPQKIRGKYFSKRNRVSGIVSIAAASIAAILLYYTKEWGLIIYGFIILFAISAVFRYISAYFLSRHYVPKIKLEKGYYFSFWQFIKKAPSNNFGRFTLYIVAITLSVNIAGPFFAVYMWNDLQLNPLWFTAVNLSATIFSPSDCTRCPAFVMNFRFFSIPRQEGFGTKVTKSLLNSSLLLTELVTFGKIDSRLINVYLTSSTNLSTSPKNGITVSLIVFSASLLLSLLCLSVIL